MINKQIINALAFGIFSILGTSSLACPFDFTNDSELDVILYDVKEDKRIFVPYLCHVKITGIAAEANVFIYIQKEKDSEEFVNTYGILEYECTENPTFTLSEFKEMAANEEMRQGFSIFPFVAAGYPDIKEVIVSPIKLR